MIPRLTFNEPASDENSYDASKAEREFVASKSNDSADETQKSSLAVEDTQRDESSKVDPEKFHAVFGVYPDKLEKEITESAKERVSFSLINNISLLQPDQKHAEPTWLQNANVHDHSAFVYNQPHVQSVAPQNQKPVQFHQKLGNVLLNVLRGVTVRCTTIIIYELNYTFSTVTFRCVVTHVMPSVPRFPPSLPEKLPSNLPNYLIITSMSWMRMDRRSKSMQRLPWVEKLLTLTWRCKFLEARNRWSIICPVLWSRPVETTTWHVFKSSVV